MDGPFPRGDPRLGLDAPVAEAMDEVCALRLDSAGATKELQRIRLLPAIFVTLLAAACSSGPTTTPKATGSASAALSDGGAVLMTLGVTFAPACPDTIRHRSRLHGAGVEVRPRGRGVRVQAVAPRGRLHRRSEVLEQADVDVGHDRRGRRHLPHQGVGARRGRDGLQVSAVTTDTLATGCVPATAELGRMRARRRRLRRLARLRHVHVAGHLRGRGPQRLRARQELHRARLRRSRTSPADRGATAAGT